VVFIPGATQAGVAEGLPVTDPGFVGAIIANVLTAISQTFSRVAVILVISRVLGDPEWQQFLAFGPLGTRELASPPSFAPT